ncbi:MAG: hypothetical protein K0Q59_4887, partial [Paenibacillus sp.]|nr:hypothetical protein [Paenibacillus sp.]
MKIFTNRSWVKWLQLGIIPVLLAACGTDGSSGNGAVNDKGKEAVNSDEPA